MIYQFILHESLLNACLDSIKVNPFSSSWIQSSANVPRSQLPYLTKLTALRWFLSEWRDSAHQGHSRRTPFNCEAPPSRRCQSRRQRRCELHLLFFASCIRSEWFHCVFLELGQQLIAWPLFLQGLVYHLSFFIVGVSLLTHPLFSWLPPRTLPPLHLFFIY